MGYLRNQLHQLCASRTWILVFLVILFIAYSNTGIVATESYNQQVDATAWDAFLLATNNTFDLTFLLFMSFLLVVEDVYQREQQTNYHWLLLVRARTRADWWLAKICSMLIVALLIMLTLVCCTAVLGHVQGLSLGFEASSFAQGVGTTSPYFPPLHPQTSYPPLLVAIVLFTAGAFTACGVIFAGIRLYLPRGITFGLAFVWIFVEYFVNQYFLFWFRYCSLTIRFFFMAHFSSVNGLGQPVWLSILVFLVLSGVAVSLSLRRLRKLDL